jgi:hypothetical protein
MDYSVLQLAALAASALVIGGLMGASSVGGVLLVPIIALICEVPIAQAIPVGMTVALCSGLAGSCVFARHGRVDRRAALASFVPAGLGAMIGAVLLPVVPPGVITCGMVTVCALGFVGSLRHRDAGPTRSDGMSGSAFGALFGMVGLGSSLSGTSGPLLLVPPLLWLGKDPREVTGMAQVIQLPVTGCACIGFAVLNVIDVQLVALLVLPVVVGVIAGARWAQALAPGRLQPLLSVVLLLAGLLTVLR